MLTHFKDLYQAWTDVLLLPIRVIVRGWNWFLHMGTKRMLFFILSAVVMTVVVLAAFINVTSRPGFCVSCHIMKPYFDAWATSAHSDVPCTECHMEPGLQGTIEAKFMALSMLANYATGLYKRSKPWAEIPDASCLRGGCHDSRLLQSTEDFKGVRFDHQPHLTEERRGRQLRCTSCHASIVQGSHISVTESTCFLCHFKPDSTGSLTQLAECTHCHSPPTGTAVADTSFDHTDVLTRGVQCVNCHTTEVAGDGYAPPTRCNSCHAELQHIERYDDHEFVHTMHVTEHKVECEICHIPIRHGREARDIALEKQHCRECHAGPDNAIEAVWNGILPGIPPTPSEMARLKLTCNSCHVEPIHLTNGAHSVPDCERCHVDGYNRLWTLWKEPTERSLSRMDQALTGFPKAARDTLRDALRIYREGNPVHNPDLLAALGERILGSTARDDIAECLTCHPSPSELAPSWNRRTVKHSKHLERGIECRHCHDPDGEPHGKLLLTLNQCSSCHHGDFGRKIGECTGCHSAQATTRAGRVEGFDEIIPDIMFEAELSCTDCHEVENDHVSRDVGPMCAACHDDDYSELLNEWQTIGTELLTAAESQLRELRPRSEHYKKVKQFADALRSDGSNTAHNHELFLEWSKRLQLNP